jgi:arginyl-tRNA synthetase
MATNIAMIMANKIGLSPRKVAEIIVSQLVELDYITKIEIAGPGFINLFLTREFFAKNIEHILKEGDTYGKNTLHEGKKIMIEHTNLNPFKIFHIGHLVNHSVGEAVSRLLENAGAEVKRVSYGGDVGLHVAKAIWGMIKSPYNEQGHEEPIAYIGRVYAEGDAAYNADKMLALNIKDINKEIFDRSDEQINKLYDWGRAESLKYFEKVYAMLGVNFAYQFFESEMAPIGMFLVDEFLAKNVFEKSEGAIVFKGEQYGLHTRVFVNSQGLPTYETKELGLTKRKMELYPFDLSIVVTANEQNEYFKVLLKVFEFVFSNTANKTRHISHGMLRFANGKMSSRKGNVISGESLIHEVQKIVADKMQDRELTSVERKNILDLVSLAAIKFSILKQSPGSDIIFDIEKSLSFEGDSGPYLQYSCVRAQSVLEKANKMRIKSHYQTSKWFSKKKIVPSDVSDLEKLLTRFDDVVQHATIELAPQQIVTYLLQLAGAFNSFYASNKIADKTDQTSPYKVALTQSFVKVMNHGLLLIGIAVPKKM